MNGMWFSAIAVDTAHEFDLSYNQVNWLSNNINLVYLPTAYIVPWVVSNRFGIRKSVSMYACSWHYYAKICSYSVSSRLHVWWSPPG